MSGSELKQRLAAILAADVAGYSRLMSTDERATVTALDAARAVFRRQIEATQGRVIDMAGDSVLAVFETAAGAVNAALTIQAEIEAATGAVLEDRRMRFRIGVHLGDVIEKSDGTVYGDGVNIAARLESLAEPGGVMVSDSVRNAVKGKVKAEFDDRGEQKVKNITDPVRTFRARPIAAGAASSVTVGGSTLSLPGKPSIAVLPFTNMSGDAEQEYFADGIVEDIITELSRFQRLFVIARNTSFTYKGRSVDVKKVARELGVHFVLEGSVRKAGNRVRVTAQLIDGETGQHVWAERYEDVLSDLFELQEKVTRQVVASMVPEIDAQEGTQAERGRRRFTEADDQSWRAQKALVDSMFGGGPPLAAEAIKQAELAIGIDRNCALAWQILSGTHIMMVFFGWAPDRKASLEAARRAADTLMMIAPNDSRSYYMRGFVDSLAGDFAAGTSDLRRAHEMNPNDIAILRNLSWAEASEGNVERAKSLAMQAMRLSPKDRFLGVAYLALAMCAFIEDDLPQMRRWAELGLQSQASGAIRRTMMIAYAIQVGDRELCRQHVEKLQAIAPDFIPSLFRGDFKAFHREEHMQKLLGVLRRAGLDN